MKNILKFSVSCFFLIFNSLYLSNHATKLSNPYHFLGKFYRLSPVVLFIFVFENLNKLVYLVYKGFVGHFYSYHNSKVTRNLDTFTFGHLYFLSLHNIKDTWNCFCCNLFSLKLLFNSWLLLTYEKLTKRKVTSKKNKWKCPFIHDFVPF